MQIKMCSQSKKQIGLEKKLPTYYTTLPYTTRRILVCGRLQTSRSKARSVGLVGF